MSARFPCGLIPSVEGYTIPVLIFFRGFTSSEYLTRLLKRHVQGNEHHVLVTWIICHLQLFRYALYPCVLMNAAKALKVSVESVLYSPFCPCPPLPAVTPKKYPKPHGSYLCVVADSSRRGVGVVNGRRTI